MNVQQPTTFDAWTGVVSAGLYLLVALAALVREPRDARAQTFFTIAVASVAPYLLPAAMPRIGPGLMEAAAFATAISLAVGSVALFHFTQVFPVRRPWIESNGVWLGAAYVVLLLGAAISAYALLPVIELARQAASTNGSGGLGAVSSGVAALLLLVLIPTVFVVTIVLPFAALLSLYRSWQDAKKTGRDGARVTTLAILLSQLAGGVLTILVVPMLHLVAPSGAAVMVAATMLFAFGLLFPIAFAVGVWRYGVLEEKSRAGLNTSGG